VTIVVRTLSERIFDVIRERIVEGKLPVMEPVRQDALAAELGVSKIPLREALARLEHEGLLTSQANRGWFVRPMSEDQAEEIYLLRLAIEPAAAAYACLHADEADRQAARHAFDVLDTAAAGDRGEVAVRNREFHVALVRPGKRLLTTQLVERLEVLAERYVSAHLEPAGAATAPIPNTATFWPPGSPGMPTRSRHCSPRTLPARWTICAPISKPARQADPYRFRGTNARTAKIHRETVTPRSGHSLAKTLSWPHLIALGVGAIVGTGIYTLTGVGAERAGPAVILAFAIAGAVCACAALAYAEMATLIPAAGSAYTFSYAAMGETVAWVVGWSLILEYSLACSTVAVGWSGYLVGWIEAVGIHLPHVLLVGPHGGGSSTCRRW
jgi:DNA-binding GntR family transcriptional regulator